MFHEPKRGTPPVIQTHTHVLAQYWARQAMLCSGGKHSLGRILYITIKFLHLHTHGFYPHCSA